MEISGDELQWGRGLFAADIKPKKGAIAFCSRLQWGRGLFAADIYLGSAFNGCSNLLQWGRGLFAADIMNNLAALRRYAELQWGRGLFAADIAVWKTAAITVFFKCVFERSDFQRVGGAARGLAMRRNDEGTGLKCERKRVFERSPGFRA